MAFLLEPNQRISHRRRITREGLAVLAAMSADKEWVKTAADREQARAAGDAARLRRAEAKLAASVTRITAAASRRRSRNINHSVLQLRELHRTWSAAWTECLHAVPFDWSETR